MTTITIWSESGGVGKTTTTLNLAAGLGLRGANTLVVDLDPQPASITDHAGYPEAKSTDDEADADVPTISDALLDDDVSFADLIIEDNLFDLIPAHESLASLERTVNDEGISMAEFLLRSALAEVEADYDYILIDPPATLNLLVDNALIASGNVLIPMEMTRKGEKSVTGVLETVEALESQLQRAQPDFTLDVVGVLPNKWEGSRLNQEVRDSLEADGVDVLPVEIPDYNVMETAWEAQLDIFSYADTHGLRAYQESLLDAYEDLAAIVAGAQDTTTDEQQTTVSA